MRKYRTAIIGFGHMHINNVAALYGAHPQVEWAACADTTPEVPEQKRAPYTREWNRDFVMKNMGIQTCYADYRKMLDKEDIDIVIVTSENAYHPEIVEACAAAGAAVCVEKPMAVSMDHALRMTRATAAAGVVMIVNWPFTWMPAARKAADVLANGGIGTILTYRMRVAHSGPLGPAARHQGVSETSAPMTGAERGATWWHRWSQGGGAMLDFCGYGAMTSRWYIGEPAVGVMGMRGNFNSQWGDADDNGAMLVRYPKSLAVIEGSWTTHKPGIPGGPVIYGAEGTLIIDSSSSRDSVRVERPGAETDIIAADPLPAGRSNVAEELIHHLETGAPLHLSLTPDFNLEVMAITDAGIRSADSGRLEPLRTTAWNIG